MKSILFVIPMKMGIHKATLELDSRSCGNDCLMILFFYLMASKMGIHKAALELDSHSRGNDKG